MGATMIFHTFANQDERREYNGSAFMEIQPCLLPEGTEIEKIVAVDSIKNWKDDSLYISDENEFYKHYSDIFNYGFYNNLKSGVVDICGINYYPPEQLERIIDDIINTKPLDYQPLLNWLENNKNHNGIYILGI
ncbi:MAG: hypothetical protein IJM96_10770 [Clostridia bacterium]|nr:hypothetical protein [Clostridia bacterium]